MVKIWSLIILLFLLLGSHKVRAQQAVKDTLADKSFEEIEKLFFKYFRKNDSLAFDIGKTFLKNAKKNNDSINIARGFYYQAVFSDPEEGLKYADSMIHFSKNIKHKYYPATGYLFKGLFHYQLDNYSTALDNYLIAREYAVERGNVLQQYDIGDYIAGLKNRTGDHKGALKISKEQILIFNENIKFEGVDRYLNLLHNIGLTYLHLKKIDSAKIYLNKGIIESLKRKDSYSYYLFLSAWASAEYFDKNYQNAIDSINKSLPFELEYNLPITYYYKFASFKGLNRNKEALESAFLIDSLTKLKYNEFPELRHVYEYLIDHYGELDNKPKQVEYIDKILRLDSVLLETNLLDAEIVRKYDTPLLIAEKEKIINELNSKNKNTNLIVFGFIMLTGFLIALVIIYKKRQRTYLKRYQELLDKNSEEQKIKKISETEKLTSGIAQPVFDEICNAIENFEKEKGFLDSKLTLNSLAKELNTNTAYLSKVINVSRGMNFSNYLHTMRIEYIAEQLKNDKKLRLYTIKAIAYEAGYASTESFSKSFYRITGVYPSYFVKKLNEEIKQTV